jgi:hypothetical protein
MLDVFASERHYIDHIAPVWKALPKEHRGNFYTRREELVDYAKSKRIKAQIGLPTENITLVASYGDYKRTLGPVIYMEHGIGHSYSNNHPSYAGGEGKDRVVLFLCQHELTADKNRATYPDAQIAIVGTPKMDKVKTRKPKGRTVAISFHWDCRVAPETRSSFLWYRPAITALARATDIQLIGHAHPKVSFNRSLQRHYKALGIEYVHDFEEVMDRADVYLIDNSSSAYEFALSGKPVIHMNAPWYRKNVSHGIRFWDYLPGPMVDNPREVLPMVRRVLDNPKEYDDQRLSVVKSLYPYKGHATEKAVGEILKVLQWF